MNPIFLEIDGSQAGPFSPEQVQQKLAKGEIADSTLAWKEGMGGWEPVAQALKAAPPALPPQQPPTGQPGPVSQPKTSGLAIASLILGCLGFVTAGLTGLPAIICGHIARSKIRNSNGTQAGSGIALAGLITGYFGFVLIVIAILASIASIASLAVPSFNVIQDKAKQVKSGQQMRQIILASKMYQSDHSEFPDSLTDLIPDYLPDESLLVDPYNEDAPDSSFIYTKPSNDAHPLTIVLMSRKEDARGRRPLALFDGTHIHTDPEQMKKAVMPPPAP